MVVGKPNAAGKRRFLFANMTDTLFVTGSFSNPGHAFVFDGKTWNKLGDGEMSEPTLGETPQPATETGAATVFPETKSETDDVQAQIDKAVESATKKANAEAFKLRKQLEALEKAEQDRKEAEMSEMDKLRTQYEKAQAELDRIQLDNQKRTIAAKVGLPEALALRIQGSTAEEMETDAKQLLEVIPKPEVKKTISPTQPGVGASKGETTDQKKARLMGVPNDNFDLIFGKGGLVEGE